MPPGVRHIGFITRLNQRHTNKEKHLRVQCSTPVSRRPWYSLTKETARHESPTVPGCSSVCSFLPSMLPTPMVFRPFALPLWVSLLSQTCMKKS